jgi:hypothetical protein
LLNKEKTEKQLKEERDREARLAKFKSLIDSSDSEDDNIDLDKLAGVNLKNYLDRVDKHLEAE